MLEEYDDDQLQVALKLESYEKKHIREDSELMETEADEERTE